MTLQKSVAGHIYTVALRFSGYQLEPSEISDKLHLKPSHAFSRSQNQSPPRWCWGYDGQGEIGFQPEWTSLQEGLEFLLETLTSKKAEIIALGHQYEGAWWCGHCQTSFDGGPKLSPKLLTELGSYELPLYIDSYFSDE